MDIKLVNQTHTMKVKYPHYCTDTVQHA